MTSLLQSEQPQDVDAVNATTKGNAHITEETPVVSPVVEHVPLTVAPDAVTNNTDVKDIHDSAININDEVMTSKMHTEIGVVHHKKKGGLPQLDSTSFSSQLFWLAISFVILYMLISKIILPRIHEVLEKRRHRIEYDLDQADEMSSKADKAKADYEAVHADALAKATQKTSNALNNVKKLNNIENAKLDIIIADKLSEANTRITASRDELISKLKPIVSDLSAEIIKTVINKEADNKKLENILSEIKW